MNHTIIAIISFSIIVPAIIGTVRLKKIDSTYYPFLLLLWVGVFNEILSFLLIKAKKTNAFSGNLYLLAESLLIIYQFSKWQLFARSRMLYVTTVVFLNSIWLVEVLFFRPVNSFASYFIIVHSFLITLLSISMINMLLATEKRAIIKHPTFIICVGFIIYFTNAVLIEAFYLYKITSSLLFQKVMMRIMVFINLLTNLLYVLAVLWIPKKRRFSF